MLLALALCLTACPGPPPYDPTLPPRLELGRGCEFTTFDEGGTLALQSGLQGGYHVFVSLRAYNLAQPSALVVLSLTNTADGQELAYPYHVRLPFDRGPGDAYELEGLLFQLNDQLQVQPHELVGQQVRLSAAIETDTGERATDERSGTLQWARNDCE